MFGIFFEQFIQLLAEENGENAPVFVDDENPVSAAYAVQYIFVVQKIVFLVLKIKAKEADQLMVVDLFFLRDGKKP